MMIRKYFGLWALLFFSLFSCKENDYDGDPTSEFYRIFNNDGIDKVYTALDILQTSDNGFIVLASADKNNVYILRTDEGGNFLWDETLEKSFINPLPTLLKKDSEIYFVCMDGETYKTQVVKINEETKTAEVDTAFDDFKYPLSVSALPDKGILLQYFNSSAGTTGVVSLMDNWSVSWSKEYLIQGNIQDQITAHISGEGKKLPFFTGSMVDGPSKYYFNGFFDTGFSLVFIEPHRGEPVGVIVGNSGGPGINALKHNTLNSFSFVRTGQNEKIYNSKAEINPVSLISSGELTGTNMPELAPAGNDKIHLFPVRGINKLIFASETQNQQIVLHAYDQLSGELEGIKYLDSTNGFKIGSVIGTSDGGIAILATCYIAGRLPRIALLKIAANDVNEFISKE